MELVTGFKGEAHISAENWADLNRGLAGDGSYVLPVGERFRAELVTNNLLKIYDGCGIFQGRQVVIPAGQSDEITIENGSQGEKRIDIVGVRYVKDESSKIETTESVYVKGTPAESDPVAPTLEEGNIRAGDLAATWALYQLELDGLNVVSVTPLFETLRSGAEVAEELEALNSNMKNAMFVEECVLDNQSLSANATDIFEVPVPVVEGYSRGSFETSVYNATSAGSGSSYCTIYQQLISGNYVRVAVRNNGSSAVKIRINVRMTYILNDLIAVR